nr:MAG TPA: hypothetical protein [Caudoviricetes sp.]
MIVRLKYLERSELITGFQPSDSRLLPGIRRFQSSSKRIKFIKIL